MEAPLHVPLTKTQLDVAYKFSAGSDDSVFGKVVVKFLSENPVSSLDFTVVCWFCK